VPIRLSIESNMPHLANAYQKDVRQECSNNDTRHKTDVYCKIADCANLCTIIAYAKVIDYELQIFESPSTTS